jgi:hypothetical protein
MSVVQSGFFPASVQGQLRAPAQVTQWRQSAVDPSGIFKHIESGVFKVGAKFDVDFTADSIRGGFDAMAESGNAINFGSIAPTTSGFTSSTAVLTFNLGEVNFHPNSFFDQLNTLCEVGTNFKAFNMRFWLNNQSAFSVNSTSPTFYYTTSADWRRDFKLTGSFSGALIVPSSMPITQNLFVKGDNDVFVSGAYLPAEYTHYLYLAAEFPSGTYQLGTYGGLGQKTFTFRFSYDYTDIDAAVRETDLDGCP